MRIVRLRMVNYRRHRDTQIEFPDGVTAIVGRNGSGKTTVIEAIAFALYGTSATRTNKTLIRHDHAAPGDPVRVEVEAEVAGQALHVVRELRGVQQTGYASLTIDGQVIVAAQAGSSEAVTAEVSRRVGLDREAFFNTVCAQQKELGRLAQKSTADRKKLVLGMLGIDALDGAIQEAGVLRRNAEARVQALQERMPGLADADAAHAQAQVAVHEADHAVASKHDAWQSAREVLARSDAALAQARALDEQRRRAEAAHREAAIEHQHLAANVDELARRATEAEQAAEQAQAVAEAARDLAPARAALEEAIAAQHAAQRLADAAGRVAALQADLDAFTVPDAPNGMLEAARSGLAACQARVQGHQTRQTVLVTQVQAVRDRLRRVAGLDEAATCPVCEQALDGHAQRLHAHLAGELAKVEQDHTEAEEALRSARVDLEDAQSSLAEAQRRQRAHEDAAAARRRIEEVLGRAVGEHATIAAAAPAAGGDVGALRSRVAEAESAATRHARLMAVASELAARVAAHEAASARLTQAHARVAAALAVLDGLPPAALAGAEATHRHESQREREAERAHAAAGQAHGLATARLEAAAARQREADESRAALDEALQRHREWQVLAGPRGSGLLDRFRSHLVSRIGPAVAAEASRLLGRFTGGRYTEVMLDDDYEIYVTENGVPYHLERFSGGESDLVHLALRLAVSRLLVERSGGAEIRFLALDEVFGSLDEERRGLVLAALRELGTLYSQVLLVTHHEDLRDALDHTLVVEELDGAAAVRMHNG